MQRWWTTRSTFGPSDSEIRPGGAARVSLQTEVGNDRALALYRSAGFEVVDELTVLNLML